MGMETAIAMVQTISLTGATPMVRLSANNPAEIAKFLDAGTLGLICPMVNTRADCEQFVAAALYAPLGARSFGPSRVRLAQGAPAYYETANQNAMLFAMIETAEALENAEAIMDVDHLSGVYIGPADLSLSLGHNPVKDQGIPEMMERYEWITAAVPARGLKVASTDYVASRGRDAFRDAVGPEQPATMLGLACGQHQPGDPRGLS